MASTSVTHPTANPELDGASTAERYTPRVAAAMPYSTATQLAQKGKLVVDRTAFEKAPKVQLPSQLLSDPEGDGDRLWGGVHAS